MYCPKCGAQNDDTSKFCLRCGTALNPVSPGAVVESPILAPLPAIVQPKPAQPLAVGALLGSASGLIGGAAAVIGWFMPWFGLGQVGNALAGLGGGLLGGLLGGGLLGGGGLGSLLGGGIGGSGFQLMMLAIQVPSLVNSFSAYNPNSSTDSITMIAIVAALLLLLVPIMGILMFRAGMGVLPYRAGTSTMNRASATDRLSDLMRDAAIGFVLMVVLFIIVSQIPFASMLLSSGFFITAGAFGVTWLLAMFARTQVRDAKMEAD